MQMPQSFLIILVLINLLSFGRYFSYLFIPIFKEAIMRRLQIDAIQVMELLEWYQWPNMILSVICGFLMDNILGMRASIFIFSFIGVLGHVLFVVSFHLNSFSLCAASQLILGIGYETIFIVQVTFCGRNFIHGKIYTAVGVLFGICFSSIFFGRLILPLIFEGLGNDVTRTAALLLLSHLVSFAAAIWLAFFSSMDGTNPAESYVLRPHLRLKFFLLTVILILYYSPNLQFWADFTYNLRWKYGSHIGFTELFFATTSLSMVIFGVVLDRVKNKMTYLLSGLTILFFSHILLTFTFISPWPIVIFVGVAHALSQLVIWVFLFFILPKNEYATAMGFLQSFQNLTLAMSNHAKPMIMDGLGLFIQGIINTACMLAAYIGAMFLWYIY